MVDHVLTIGALLAESDEILKGAGVDSPRLSSQILVGHALGLDRVRLVVERGRVLSAAEVSGIRSLVARRAAGEPVAYILGEKEFFGLAFRVNSDVLVPRPETEHLVEEVQRHFMPDQGFRFADFGTGSGCIAVTLAHLFPHAIGLAFDISIGALGVACGNARLLAVEQRIGFVQADLELPVVRGASLDLVVSNPPYVSEMEYGTVSHEVSDFEPRGALVPDVSGESDGLECYRALIPLAGCALRSGGWLIMEIGYDQGESVPQIVDNCSLFDSVNVVLDLAGRDRIVVAKRF
ncbi:peptide chain release factor N(5)-glutamine methyltransferase [Desulfovibrio ferrophilus]|uniref:Release factor glutamine methyltransferase n=1 Tax=Desulfovibrio ferrophilus TaxID=241368 RepID=A0A2Z6AV35_9BACT|nr:peptide chain release factor N(5)-glutamine methyltransferase [Desulfovibrio ferrophilus]BBD07094.1 release factor glutamine methyltransferase [Desulfovibrio ferrophilus]